MAPSGDGCAWLTGASSGLGRALALRLARDGRHVVASARRREELDKLAAEAKQAGGRIDPMPLDVTDRQAASAAVTEIEKTAGPIGLAVLNAGTHVSQLARDFDVDKVRRLVELNLMGSVHCLQPVMARMIERRRGHIAIVSSLAGYAGLPTSAAYGATKAGLINMAEALRPELDAMGVKLQVVNPGFVRTPLTDQNPFPMPFLMEVEDAAEAFYRGLQSERFEIVFPRRFAYLMKLLRLLPYPLFFAATRRILPER